MSPRASKDPNKIKDVELARGRWVYRPFVPKAKRHYTRTDRRGRLAPPIKLGVEADPWHRIVTAHARAFEIYSAEIDRDTYTLNWIDREYRESSYFLALAKSTQKKAITTRRILKHELKIEGRDAQFGELRVEEITQPMIYRLRELRLKAYQANGRDGHSQCNREISYLSGIVTWAREHHEKVTTNPFRGIRKLTENVTDRYVTHDEYWQQYDIAHEVADYLPVVFEMVYLLAQRGIEATDIELTDIQVKEVNGQSVRVIRVRRRKGSKTTDIRIKSRHQAFIDACMALHRKRPVSGKYLLPGMNGEKMKKGTIDDAMTRLRKLMASRGLTTYATRTESVDDVETPLFWHLHLLKAKGITDAENKAIGGHKTQAMQDRYTRKVGTFDAPSQPDRNDGSPTRSPTASITKIGDKRK